MYITHKSANFIRNAFNKIHFVLIADAGQICVHIPASLTSLGLSSWRYRHIEAVAVVVSPADRTRISCNRDMTCCDTVAVLGWGQGGTGPPNLAQAPKFLIGSRLYWGYIGVRGYTPYTNLWCFWQRIMTSFFIIKQVIRDIRFNSEQENVHCTVPHQTAEFLSLYVLSNLQRLLVGGTISI